MNSDLRISTSLVNHPKVKRLMRVLGDRGFYSLISLWSFAALNRPDGNLTGFDDLDLAIAANWDDEPKELFDALCQIGFLDCNDEKIEIHDWATHNPYAAGAQHRSDVSRFNKLKRDYPKLHAKLSAQGRVSIAASEYAALVKQRFSSADSPTPSPSPIPSPKDKDNVGQSVPRQHIPYSEIVSFLNKEAGTSFKATTQSTRNHIKARFNEGFSLDNFKAVISTMVDKWQHDEKMVQYIRPQTLFGTKFESYLQSSVEAQPKRSWNVQGTPAH